MRAQSVAALLGAQERTDAERVLSLAASASFDEHAQQAIDADVNLMLRRELGRLVELLSRRGAKAVPIATLGRALLAELAGDSKAAAQLRRECDVNLSMFGF